MPTKEGDLPEMIAEVADNILREVLSCRFCAKGYRIVQRELGLYRKLGVPLPRACHDCRYDIRLRQRNPRRLFARHCARCEEPIKTSYAPERLETVYCIECYVAQVQAG